MTTRRSFQLLKFPWIVLTEIICLAHPDVLVRLSLCSQKMHHVIKRENRKFSRFAKLSMHARSLLTAQIDISTESYVVLAACPIADSVREPTLQNLAIRETNVWSAMDRGTLITFWEDVVLGYQEIMKYVLNLYGLDIHTMSFGQQHIWMIDWVQSRQAVVSKASLKEFEQEWISAEEYQQVMSTCTAVNLHMNAVPPATFDTLDAFRPRDKFCIAHGSWIRGEHLLRMTCNNVRILEATLTSYHVNVFLKHWVGGQLDQLETIRITNLHSFGPDGVFLGLEARITITAERKQYTAKNGESVVVRNTHDIRREDGRVASVMLIHEDLVVVVWPADHFELTCF